MSAVALRDSQNQLGYVRQVHKIVYLTAAAQLEPMQQTVHATASTSYPSYTLTLPRVAEAAGQFISIVSSIANAQVVTVTDAGDDSAFVNLTLDTDGDKVILYSDGIRWWTVVNGIA